MLDITNLKKIRGRLLSQSYGLNGDTVLDDKYLSKRSEELDRHFELLIDELENWYTSLNEQGIYGQGSDELVSDDFKMTEKELYKFISDGAIYGYIPFFELVDITRKKFDTSVIKSFNSLEPVLLNHFRNSSLYSISINPTTIWLAETLPDGYVPVDFDFLIDSSWVMNRSLDCFGRNINIEELVPPIVKKVDSNLTQEDLLILASDKLPLFFAVNYGLPLEYDENIYQLKYVGHERGRLFDLHNQNTSKNIEDITEIVRLRYKELKKLIDKPKPLNDYIEGFLYVESMAERIELTYNTEKVWTLKKRGEDVLRKFLDESTDIEPAHICHNVPAILQNLSEGPMSIGELQKNLMVSKLELLHTLLLLSGDNREICPYVNKGGCFVQSKKLVE